MDLFLPIVKVGIGFAKVYSAAPDRARPKPPIQPTAPPPTTDLDRRTCLISNLFRRNFTFDLINPTSV